MRRHPRPEVNCKRIEKQVLPLMRKLLKESVSINREVGFSGWFDKKKFHIIEMCRGSECLLYPKLYAPFPYREPAPLVGNFFFHTHPSGEHQDELSSMDLNTLQKFDVPHTCLGIGNRKAVRKKPKILCWTNIDWKSSGHLPSGTRLREVVREARECFYGGNE